MSNFCIFCDVQLAFLNEIAAKGIEKILCNNCLYQAKIIKYITQVQLLNLKNTAETTIDSRLITPINNNDEIDKYSKFGSL